MADPAVNDKLMDEELTNNNSGDDSDILKVDYIEYDAPKFFPFKALGSDYPVDQSTLKIFGTALILWVILIWKLKTKNYNCKPVNVFILLSIVFWLFQIHDRRNEKLSHVSNELTSKHRARDSAIIILSIVAIFTAFSWTNLQPKDQAILGSSLISLLIGSFWYTSEDNSIQYRSIRNIHIATMTLGILFFMLFIIKDMICPFTQST
jgi:hypothetical protein